MAKSKSPKCTDENKLTPNEQTLKTFNQQAEFLETLLFDETARSVLFIRQGQQHPGMAWLKAQNTTPVEFGTLSAGCCAEMIVQLALLTQQVIRAAARDADPAATGIPYRLAAGDLLAVWKELGHPAEMVQPIKYLFHAAEKEYLRGTLTLNAPAEIAETWDHVNPICTVLLDLYGCLAAVTAKLPDNRGEYIYNAAVRGTPWKEIKNEVNRHDEWESLGSEQAAINAANRYAKKNSLSAVPRRRRGPQANNP